MSEGFSDWLPVSAKKIAPGEYSIHDASDRRLFYVEGAAFSEWLVEAINAYPAYSALKTACELASGPHSKLGIGASVAVKMALEIAERRGEKAIKWYAPTTAPID